MRTRIGLAVFLLTVGTAAAKPPGLPQAPLVDGTEPPLVAREFYQVDAKPACGHMAYTDPASFWAAVERVRTVVVNLWK